MAHKRQKDTAALAVEAARLEAKKTLDDSGAVESAALSDVALSDVDVTAVGGPSASLVAKTIPPVPKPAWVEAASPLHHGTTDNANGAWHDFFKEPVPSTPPTAQWTGPDATYSYYEGGRVLVAYRKTGLFAVKKTPPLKPVRTAR